MRSSRLVGWVEVVDDPPREKESFAPLVDMMIAQDLAAGHSREKKSSRCKGRMVEDCVQITSPRHDMGLEALICYVSSGKTRSDGA